MQREDAPFSGKVWEKIDEAVVNSAKAQLAGRRLLHIEGPYGLGLKSLPGSDQAAEGASAVGASLAVSRALPVVAIRSEFALAARDVAAFEETGMPLDVVGAASAAIACARQEDDLIFYGSKSLGVEGLLTAKGTLSVKLNPWGEVGKAADDIIQAVTKLDSAGFHGPYSLALAPDMYNLLLRRYPQGDSTEMEHLRQIVTDGIVKAPALSGGSVLLASGAQFAAIVVGQDLAAGFVGPSNGGYEFTVSESVTLRLLQASSVCVLR